MNAALYLWQLPQHLIALALLLWFRDGYCTYRDGPAIIVRMRSGFRAGLCLGGFVFVSVNAPPKIIRHEKGHARQSRMLGPLYLLVIGIPSLCIHWWDRLFHRDWTPEDRVRWYYSRWPESWADRLGGCE